MGRRRPSPPRQPRPATKGWDWRTPAVAAPRDRLSKFDADSVPVPASTGVSAAAALSASGFRRPVPAHPSGSLGGRVRGEPLAALAVLAGHCVG
jgi:hypothetical protein